MVVYVGKCGEGVSKGGAFSLNC